MCMPKISSGVSLFLTFPEQKVYQYSVQVSVRGGRHATSPVTFSDIVSQFLRLTRRENQSRVNYVPINQSLVTDTATDDRV